MCSPFSSLALVADGVVYGDIESHSVWYQPWNGEPRIVGNNSEVGPAGDANSTTAAWFDGTELVMFDTATGRELARAEQRPRSLPDPRRENTQGNTILEVTPDAVSWPAESGLYRFDRATGETTTLSRRLKIKPSFTGIDTHDGVTAVTTEAGLTGIISSTGKTLHTFEAGQLSGPLLFSADGRYLAGITELAGTYHAVVADVGSGEIYHPSKEVLLPLDRLGLRRHVHGLSGLLQSEGRHTKRRRPTARLRRQRPDLRTHGLLRSDHLAERVKALT